MDKEPYIDHLTILQDENNISREEKIESLLEEMKGTNAEIKKLEDRLESLRKDKSINRMFKNKINLIHLGHRRNN